MDPVNRPYYAPFKRTSDRRSLASEFRFRYIDKDCNRNVGGGESESKWERGAESSDESGAIGPIENLPTSVKVVELGVNFRRVRGVPGRYDRPPEPMGMLRCP